MYGFNWVDAVFLLILAYAVYIGIKVGFLTLLLMFGGFFSSLFFAGWLFPLLLPIHDPTLKTIIDGNLVLIVALYTAIRGFYLGKHVHLSLRALEKKHLHSIESVAGISLSVISALVAIWLIAAGIGSLPFAGLSNSVTDAFTVQTLDSHLPAVPAVFADFSRLINPNAAPAVFIKELPNSSLGAAPAPPTSMAVIKAGSSVVRITSFGCGGVVDGSGFAVGSNLIATNAHVIAGVKRPIIKFGSQSYAGVPVLFDPNLDFALLRVAGLQARPLAIDALSINSGTSVTAIGFPASIYTLSSGVVRNNLEVFGSNIYGLGNIGRNIYEIEVSVAPGSSGGPVLTSNGKVVGIIFSRSDLYSGYGFALTSPSILSKIRQDENASRQVGTGACYVSQT